MVRARLPVKEVARRPDDDTHWVEYARHGGESGVRGGAGKRRHSQKRPFMETSVAPEPKTPTTRPVRGVGRIKCVA